MVKQFHCARKNQVTFKSAMREEISGKKPENNGVSQIGIAVPMQGLRELGDDGTARCLVGGGGLDPSWKVG